MQAPSICLRRKFLLKSPNHGGWYSIWIVGRSTLEIVTNVSYKCHKIKVQSSYFCKLCSWLPNLLATHSLTSTSSLQVWLAKGNNILTLSFHVPRMMELWFLLHLVIISLEDYASSSLGLNLKIIKKWGGGGGFHHPRAHIRAHILLLPWPTKLANLSSSCVWQPHEKF